MTEVQEEVREGSLLPEPHPVEPTRRGAQRVKSVALPSGTASATALSTVTVRVQRAGEIASRAVALLDKPGTLAHSQPPTFRQAHDRHKDCADWFGTPVMKCLRRAWGWFHLLVILPPLYLLAWVTESPLRLLVAAALITAVWLFS